MDPDSKRVASTGLIAFFSCFVVTLLLVGWDAVEVATWGLKCNKLSKTCEDQIYSPGRYLVGPFNHFIEFPASIQTIEFSQKRNAKAPPLKTRTVEGLSLGLSVSFQYEIIKDQIHELYSMNNLEYEQTFVRIARDIILQTAGDYEAPEYWVGRKDIAIKMRKELNKELFKAHAKCMGLQILDIDLPDQYEDSIVTTQVEVQNKRMKEFEQKVAMIQNEIQVLRSENSQEIFTINAQAEADSLIEQQKAIAKANKILIDAEMEVYSEAREASNFTAREFNQYVYMMSLLQKKEKPNYMINAPKSLTYQAKP